MTKTVHCGGTLQRVSLCTTMSAPKRTVGLATNSQFYTFPWGSPREAQPSPKTQLRRLGASAEVAMVAAHGLPTAFTSSASKFRLADSTRLIEQLETLPHHLLHRLHHRREDL